MSQPIIQVENLGKSYLVGHQSAGQESYTAFRDVLGRTVKNFGRKALDMARGRQIVQGDEVEEFWALNSVSFNVNQGEVVGVIGRNGAGKSTLLKILSRITEPTKGKVTLGGRVASLLEVGTGFHPELTGRENIFLNGAILGMTRSEIKHKFDEIVDFAGVERFLDTPVKRYSSGMYVRLAFAVAAHLEPEILVVDEVLAVGDAEFQKKCLGKMRDVAADGRTVLFVSHNMAAVKNLCQSSILLSAGKINFHGQTSEALERYINRTEHSAAEVTWPTNGEAPGSQRIGLRAVRVCRNKEPSPTVMLNDEIEIEIDYLVREDGYRFNTSIHLLSANGVEVLATANLPSANLAVDSWYGRLLPQGEYRSVCVIPKHFLNEGQYFIRVAIASDGGQIEFMTDEIIGFRVYDGGEMRKEYTGRWIGVVRPKLAWSTESLLENSQKVKA